MDVLDRARLNASTVLRRLGQSGAQASIAVAMQTSESTVSRIKNDHLESVCSLLAHAGFKIIPIEMRCFSPSKVDALLTLAKGHLDTIKNVDQLQWDDGGDCG